MTRGSWPPAGPEALRGKSIYRRPNKNTNDDDGARSASFGFRKRWRLCERKRRKVAGRGEIRRMKVERGGRVRKRESGGGRELDRATHAKRGKKLSIKRRERPRRLSGTKTSPSAVRSSNALFSFLLLPQDRIDPRRLSI